MTTSRFDARKRHDICKARVENPAIATRALTTMFATSGRVVTEALRHDVVYWETIIAGDTPQDEHEPDATYLCIIAEPVVKQGTVVGYRHAEVPGGAWVETPATTVAALLEDLAADGWRLAGMARVPGTGGGAFQGAYELVLAGTG